MRFPLFRRSILRFRHNRRRFIRFKQSNRLIRPHLLLIRSTKSSQDFLRPLLRLLRPLPRWFSYFVRSLPMR